ncbi:MAG: phosphatase PAP2 family protein [Succiniclasticum sp.]|nr:phosphatase PAP2 family protein [Succiniclasticum sp.]MEE3478436.1 phosphatase PAP2 family protein [Succiniclasticum sp.]
MISTMDAAVAYLATELTEWDYSVLLWIQQHLRTSGGDFFWNTLTGGAFWVFACLAVWLVLRYQKQGRTAVLYACSALLPVLAGTRILKHLILRPRPYETFYDLIPVVHAGGSSFPSSHTAAAFAIALMLYRFLPRRFGMPALALAALTSFSRLYLGVHYPSDVAAGILLACGAAFLAEKIVPALRQLADKYLGTAPLQPLSGRRAR